jgi:hypothetical protein
MRKTDKKTQQMFDRVTNRIANQNKGVAISPATGLRYEEPLKDEHPGLDLALMYAQPGNIIIKALAPSMAKGFVEGIATGNTDQAMLSMLVPEGNVAKSLVNLDKINKPTKITLSEPEKY